LLFELYSPSTSAIKEDRKSPIKGLDNLLFCGQRNKPTLRFPRYHDAWQKVKLKEIAARITRRNKDNQTDLALTIAAQYSLVDQVSFFNKQVVSSDMSSYYLLNKGEFAYNKSYSKDHSLGAVKCLDLYKKRGIVDFIYLL
jgi:type I restriction enzyme S subunit